MTRWTPRLIAQARGSQVARNAGYNLVGWLVPVATNLLVLPYSVRILGPDQYGVFVLINSVVGVLGLFELGLGNAIVKYVAEYAATGRWEEADRAVSTSVAALAIVGLGCGILLYAGAHRLAMLFVHGNPTAAQAAGLCFRIAALGIVATMAVSPLSGVPQALQRYGLYNVVASAFGIANGLATVLVLLAGFGLVGLVAMTVVSTFLMGFVYLLIASALIPGFRFRVGLPREQTRRLVTFGGYTLVGRISYLVNTQVFRVIVAIVLSTGAVTYLTVTSKAALAFAGVFATMTNVLCPAASATAAREDFPGVLHLLTKTERIVAGLGFLPFLALAALSKPLLSLWMGPGFAGEAWTLLAILAVAHYLYVLAMPSNSIALGIGHARMVGLLGVGATSILLASVFPLVRVLGLNGVGISVSLCAAAGLAVPVKLRYVLRQQVARQQDKDALLAARHA